MNIKVVITQLDFKDAINIRIEVFVKEQGVPLEEEKDEQDIYSDHVIVYDTGKPVGTGRLRIFNGAAKLERISILSSHRRCGLGQIIVRELEKIARQKSLLRAQLNSQTHVECFYIKLGYQRVSDIFMEAGIPHVLMIKDLLDNNLKGS